MMKLIRRMEGYVGVPIDWLMLRELPVLTLFVVVVIVLVLAVCPRGGGCTHVVPSRSRMSLASLRC